MKVELHPVTTKTYKESVPVPNHTEAVTAPHRNPIFTLLLYIRDLKTVGQYGEPNEKDKLRYASLQRQIQRALKKGYDEGED